MKVFDLSVYDVDGKDAFEEVFYGEDFVQVTEEQIVEQRRWTTCYSQVLKHVASGKYYAAIWDVGSTEYQETEPNLVLTEVEPKEVTVTQYFAVEG